MSQLHDQSRREAGRLALGLVLAGLAGAVFGISRYPDLTGFWWALIVGLLAVGAGLLLRSPQPRGDNRRQDQAQGGRDDEPASGLVPRTVEPKTRSLELLYDVAASINVSRDLDDLLVRFINTLSDTLGAVAASIRLTDDNGQLRLVTSFGVDPGQLSGPADLSADHCVCGKVMQQGHLQEQIDIERCCECCGIIAEDFPDKRDLRMVVVPLQYRNHVFGVLALYVEQNKLAVHEDIVVLLTSLGQHLGMAIERAGLDKETERLSRYEERTSLAHELHDSLAQTLASLRFQIRTLDETMHQGRESAVWEKLEGVETSIDEAYMELRELIARFRAPIVDHAGLAPSIEKIVQRFKQSSGILTFFYNDLGDEQLPEGIQPQVVRIVQEALTNVRKHSQATAVRVMIRKDKQGHYRVLIEDDGIGFDLPASRRPASGGEHIGLAVMRERAEQINGELRVESEVGEGTRVHLTFGRAQQDKQHNELKRAAL